MPTPEECQKEVDDLRKKIFDTLPKVSTYSPVRSFATPQVESQRLRKIREERSLKGLETDALHKQCFIDASEKYLNTAKEMGLEDLDERYHLVLQVVVDIRHISFPILLLLIDSNISPGENVSENLFIYFLHLECIREYDRQMDLEPVAIDMYSSKW